MKSFTYAAIAALSAVASAQTTTPAPGWSPGWFDGDGDGNGGPGPFGGRLSLDPAQQSVFDSFTSAHPSGPSDSAAWASLTSALSLTGPPSGAPSFVTGFKPGGWGYGSGNGGWGPGSGRGGPFGAGAHGGWGPDDGEFCSTGSWTSGAWTQWYVSLLICKCCRAHELTISTGGVVTGAPTRTGQAGPQAPGPPTPIGLPGLAAQQPSLQHPSSPPFPPTVLLPSLRPASATRLPRLRTLSFQPLLKKALLPLTLLSRVVLLLVPSWVLLPCYERAQSEVDTLVTLHASGMINRRFDNDIWMDFMIAPFRFWFLSTVPII
jgi:hypothetical protein